MRFYHDRQTGITRSVKPIKRRSSKRCVVPPPPNIEDRRGRHTKADLLAKRARQREIMDTMLYPPRPQGTDGCQCTSPHWVNNGTRCRRCNLPPPTPQCNCDRYTVPVDYANGYQTCTGCGLVLATHQLQPDFKHHRDHGNGTANIGDRENPAIWGFTLTGPGTPYKRINHLAELLKQAMDMDPRIPKDDMHEILAEAQRQYSGLGVDPITFDATVIKGFIRPLGQKKLKKYGEHWLQVKRYICGHDYYNKYGPEMMGEADARRVHERYGIVSRVFDELKRSGHPLFKFRHNIPYLNTCVQHLLHQDGGDKVQRYGWYFTGLETAGSRLITEYRISIMLQHIIAQPNIQGAYQWAYKCLLPSEDIALYRNEPKRFLSILRQQIRICQQQPRRSRSAAVKSTSTTTEEQLLVI